MKFRRTETIVLVAMAIVMCLTLVGAGGVVLYVTSRPAMPVATAVAVATSIPTAAVQSTNISSFPATWTPVPTLTPEPPTDTPTAGPTLTPVASPTPRPPTKTPTRTPLPTATLRPTETRIPTQTTKPVDTALVNYLKAFAPIANKIWATFPGDSKVDPSSYVDTVEGLDKQLEAMTVPEDAKLMHDSFRLVASEVALYHHNHAGALLFPGQFNQYMTTAKSYADSALSSYFNEYLPARDELLRSVGLSAKEIGFVE